MELINNKLELALSRLNISQEDLGSIMGLSQSSVSLIKNGKRKTIPNKLLCYLMKHGFNLNMLFDDNVSVDEFLDYKPDPDLTELITSKNETLRHLQKKTPVIIEIAGVIC